MTAIYLLFAIVIIVGLIMWFCSSPSKPVPTKTLNLADFSERMRSLMYEYAPYTRAHLPLLLAVREPSARIWAIISPAMGTFQPLQAKLRELGIKEIQVPDRQYNGNMQQEFDDIAQAMQASIYEVRTKDA